MHKHRHSPILERQVEGEPQDFWEEKEKHSEAPRTLLLSSLVLNSGQHRVAWLLLSYFYPQDLHKNWNSKSFILGSAFSIRGIAVWDFPFLISPLVILRLQWYVQGCWIERSTHWLFWGCPLTTLERALLLLLALPCSISLRECLGWDSPEIQNLGPFLPSTPGHWVTVADLVSIIWRAQSFSTLCVPCLHAFPCSPHSGFPPRIKDLGGSLGTVKLQWTRKERERTEISTIPSYLELLKEMSPFLFPPLK